jgi:hypothetical protein
MKPVLQKGVFYVIENEGISDPGFLVFLPKQAPIFLNTKTKSAPPCTLRMRVSPSLGDGGGTVLVASLDLIQHTLRIEDVWMWKGHKIYDSEPYSSRRVKLKEFVERDWVPDARLLGGITTSILNPKSINVAFKDTSSSVHSYELIPEMAGKRRMWIPTSAKQVPSVLPVVRTSPPSLPPSSVLAKPIGKLPDIYDIYSSNGEHKGKASVQQFALSQQLRSECTLDGIWVDVEWREEFNGFEIKAISTASK